MKYELKEEERKAILNELGNMPINMAGNLFNYFTNLKPVIEEVKEKVEEEIKE